MTLSCLVLLYIGLGIGPRSCNRARGRANKLFKRSTEGQACSSQVGLLCVGFEQKKQFLWTDLLILSLEWVSAFDLIRQILDQSCKYLSLCVCLTYWLFKLSSLCTHRLFSLLQCRDLTFSSLILTDQPFYKLPTGSLQSYYLILN